MTSQPPKVGGSKLIEYPEAFERWLRGEDQGPLAIEVSAAGGCNHGCIHCGYQQYVPFQQRKTFIDRERFLGFLRDFHDLGGKEVFFAGKGEPLLNPDIHEYCRAGAELGIDMVMSTNGVPLGERKMQNLMPFMKWVRFSVNGGNSESYARIHRCNPADFDRMERNITAACEMRDREKLRVKLAIQLVLYEKNIDSAREVVALHKRCGTDFMFIRNVIDSKGEFVTAMPEIEAFLKEVDDPPYVRVRWETFREFGTARKWTKCYGINFRCTMDEHGAIATCLRNLVVPSVVGNIHETTFREIWLSERRREMTREIQTGRWIPACQQWCDVSADNVLAEDILAERGIIPPT